MHGVETTTKKRVKILAARRVETRDSLLVQYEDGTVRDVPHTTIQFSTPEQPGPSQNAEIEQARKARAEHLRQKSKDTSSSVVKRQRRQPLSDSIKD